VLADRFARGLGRPARTSEDGSKPRAMIDVLPWWDIQESGFPIFQTSLVGERLWISPDFVGLVERAFKRSPIIFAAVTTRMHLFAEARFQFQRLVNGRPGPMFGNPDLAILETPWPGGTTGDLLSIAEGMNSCAGNFFAVRKGDEIKPLRPDFVTLIIDAPDDDTAGPWSSDARVLGYAYLPPGGNEPEFFLPEEIVHYMPVPDPEVPWRGMSWITPVIEDLLADQGMVGHKRKYLEVGGTPNYAVKVPAENLEKFDAWVDKYEERREGRHGNPYRTLFIAAAADVVPLGSNLQEIDFAQIQAAGEVRIAAAARTHPALLGLSDSLKGSALNAGNLKEIRRIFASMVMRPLWRNFAGSMARVVNVPSGSELCTDLRDVAALQEDATERAEAQRTQAQTIWTLVQAGFEPEAAVTAVTSDDLTGLTDHHTGLTSVQLQPPGSDNKMPAPTPPGGALATITGRAGMRTLSRAVLDELVEQAQRDPLALFAHSNGDGE
jgi:hypothetical protein